MIMSYYSYDLTHLRFKRNICARFLVQMKTSKYALEINRPLDGATCGQKEMKERT